MDPVNFVKTLMTSTYYTDIDFKISYRSTLWCKSYVDIQQ